jgi:hypothetical protein
LQLDRATYCLCGAREFSQKSVTGQLEHPPIAACNSRDNEMFTQLFESFERTQFVQFHQAAVSDHVSGKDRGEPALHLLVLQNGGLMQGEIRIFRWPKLTRYYPAKMANEIEPRPLLRTSTGASSAMGQKPKTVEISATSALTSTTDL